MNISNLYRTFGAGDCRADRSAFFIMTGETWANVDFERTNWIRIHYGEAGIDDAWMNPIYLATLRENGGYQVERAERYLEVWNEKWKRRSHPERVIDIRHLPDALAGMTFHKALSYEFYKNVKGDYSDTQVCVDIKFDGVQYQGEFEHEHINPIYIERMTLHEKDEMRAYHAYLTNIYLKKNHNIEGKH